MAITVYGVDPAINEPEWSKLFADSLSGAQAREVVASGFSPSVATGVRLISVPAGRAAAAGVLAESDATATVSLAENTGSNSRIDLVCLQIDWAGTASTGGTLVAVQGAPAATPVAPALTRNAGSLWQVPLMEVLVRPGVGQIAAGDATVVAPVADTGWRVLSLPAGWAQGSPSLAVRKRGAQVTMAGRFSRDGGAVSVGSTATWAGAVIPAGFRPQREHVTSAWSGIGGATPRTHALVVKTDGSIEVVPVSGDIPSNGSLRASASWVTEVA